MTLVDERPAVTSAERPQPPARSPLSTWRFASRLARREVRRRPGRTLLVMALVVVPVAAMTLGSIAYRTIGDDDWASEYGRRYGTSDVSFAVEADRSVDLTSLPAGSRTVSYVDAYSPIVGPDGVTFRSGWSSWIWFTDIPLDDPLTAGIVEVRSGRAPTAPDELLVSAGIADFYDVDVGSTLRLERPSGDWRIVGIGRTTDQHRQDLVVAHDVDRSRLAPDVNERTLVQLPELTDPGPVIDAIASQGPWVVNRWHPDWEPRSDVAVIAWGWVGGVLALVAVGIVIAAAFATSARRQLVTIGQLSSNGAPPGLVRRTLMLQGSWTGALGAVAGIAIGAVGLLASRPLLEQIINRAVGPYRVSMVHLVVIAATAIVAATVAAAVPARSAAAIPVLSALSGRRPLGTPPRRLVPIGLALFLGGLGLLVVAASGAQPGQNNDLFALVAIVGALGVVFGMCCSTPLVVALVGRLGGAGGSGTWRLAARSTARSRTRSAGVVTAVATAGAFAVAGATVAGMALDERTGVDGFPYDSVYLDRWVDQGVYVENEDLLVEDLIVEDPFTEDPIVDAPPPARLALTDAQRMDIERTLPGASWIPVNHATFDPPAVRNSASWAGAPGDGRLAVVVDDTFADLIGLSADDRALLDEVDLVFLHDWYGVGESGELTVPTASGDVTLTTALSTGADDVGWFHVFISSERAAAAGLDVVETGMIVRNDSALSNAQRDAVNQMQSVMDGWSGPPSVFVEPGDEAVGDERASIDERATTGISVMTYWQPSDPPVLLVNVLIVAGAVLLTLLVVAIGLSLSSAESRDERDVLVAVGAPPATLSRVSGAKAIVLAGTGVLLAVPTGFLPIWVVYRATRDAGEPAGATFPWLTVAAIVVAVPAVAGIASWVTSSLARRIRPVRMSTLAAD